VVESLKEIAPHKGLAGHQTLLKAYISEGLRKDEALFLSAPSARLIEALRKHGMPDTILNEAVKGLEAEAG